MPRNNLVLAVAAICLIGLGIVVFDANAQRNTMLSGDFGPSFAGGVKAGAGIDAGPAHMILFEKDNRRGMHKHVFNEEADLQSDMDVLNGSVASFVVESGSWRFYREPNFEMPYSGQFGPGIYQLAASGITGGIGSIKKI